MTRLLGLALYGQKAASTRYRLGQYVPGLAQHGIDLQIHHLLGDDYLRRRFSGDSISWTNLLHAGWSRLGSLWGRDEFDAAILHCELLPLMPGWVERILLPKPYIYDFDDAFYLKYRSGKLRIMRPFLGEKFDTVIAGAAAVTAGNNILVEYARRLNANTHFLPTVVNTERYMPAPTSTQRYSHDWVDRFTLHSALFIPTRRPSFADWQGNADTIGCYRRKGAFDTQCQYCGNRLE
jgi:hypothetical protein